VSKVPVKLLQEWAPFSYTADSIRESRDRNGGKIILKGVLQKAETLNQNGRIYPHAILEREVRNYQKFINERRALGELDHPSTSVVELQKVSHVVTSAVLEGDVVMGEIEVLTSTPMGKILEGLITSGIKVGISSRGVGSTSDKGDHQLVNDDFQLICWDMVAEPSTPGAFMMSEGKVIYDRHGNVIGNKPLQESPEKSGRILSAAESILTFDE